MNTYFGFYEALVEDPDEWTVRRIFADWLEENGYLMLAEGQRWQAENEKAPELYDWSPQHSIGRHWSWWNGKHEKYVGKLEHLPEHVWEKLVVHVKQSPYQNCKDYPTLDDADLALAEVLWAMKGKTDGRPIRSH